MISLTHQADGRTGVVLGVPAKMLRDGQVEVYELDIYAFVQFPNADHALTALGLERIGFDPTRKIQLWGKARDGGRVL